MLKPAPALFIAAAISVSACAPLTQDPDLVAQASEDADPDAVRCKRVIRTGTRISTKVCHTNSDWDRITERSKEDLENAQRTSTQSTTYTTNGGS